MIISEELEMTHSVQRIRKFKQSYYHAVPDCSLESVFDKASQSKSMVVGRSAFTEASLPMT